MFAAQHFACGLDLFGNKLGFRDYITRLSMKNQLTKINEQMVLLQDEKKGYSTASGHLITERQNAVEVLNGYVDQRDELKQESQANIAVERQEFSER